MDGWQREDLAAWLRLALTPGVGRHAARRLLARFGLPATIFSQALARLQDCVGLAQAAQLHQPPAGWEAAVEATWQWLAQHGPGGAAHALVVLGDARYPSGLLQTEDPPLMLYAMGPADWLERPAPLLEPAHSLAIVGSRNPTAQGAEHAQAFGRTLAEQGWTVVSGLALGIDAAAHQGALAALPARAAGEAPRTVAVIGTGLDRVYPRQNKALAQQLAQQGLILSEYPLGTPPMAAHFPQRNRLIAGLSSGTLVVEAALASGSLITARLAAEQGREVFAIPGSIHAPQSHGCHALIRQGAKLVEAVQDILDELPAGPRARGPAAAPASEPPAPAAAEHPVLQALGYDPLDLDSLQARTGWGMADLQALLLEWELDGQVARLPGGRFQRLGRG